MEFITLKEAKRRKDLNRMTYKTKFNKVNVGIGLFFVGFGVVTFPIPTGSIFSIMFGLSLIFNPISLNKLVTGIYFDIKFKVGCWL